MKTFTLKTDHLTGEDYNEVYLRGRQLLADSLVHVRLDQKSVV